MKRETLFAVTLPVAVLLGQLHTVTAMAASRAELASLMTNWYAANAECRGGSGDNPQTIAQCERREEIGGRLSKLGCSVGAGSKWVCKRHTPNCKYDEQIDSVICR